MKLWSWKANIPVHLMVRNVLLLTAIVVLTRSWNIPIVCHTYVILRHKELAGVFNHSLLS